MVFIISIFKNIAFNIYGDYESHLSKVRFYYYCYKKSQKTNNDPRLVNKQQ